MVWPRRCFDTMYSKDGPYCRGRLGQRGPYPKPPGLEEASTVDRVADSGTSGAVGTYQLKVFSEFQN